ncbi:TonB-dependent receptor domain-containing protein [Novosphingobium rosa]|uniref:TonB-dependent receptor domain-containing protein n=1 Tax=Novosphingobium rosa TaxID=76978 RepID=UPI000836CEA3|nr:TonB-dependent receptor [Novosphingobium rosa]
MNIHGVYNRGRGGRLAVRHAVVALKGGCALLAFCQALPAMAQSGTPAAQAAEPAGDIVVTGSRISRKDYVADSPIMTVSSQALQSTGDVTIEAKLNTLPQFVPGATAYTNNVASSGQATLNLRGLGASRNLVLLDGQRMQPSSATMAIDLNTMPSILLDNVEVISGGASAVYGSDAVSGVVNLKIKHRFTGLQMDVQSGLNGAGDGATRDVSILAGTKFAGGRGHIMGAFEYYNRDAVYSRDRNFYASAFAKGGNSSASNTLPTGTYTPTAGNLPNATALNTLLRSYGYTGSAYSNSTILGFNNDGSLFTDTNGVFNYRGTTAGYGARGTSLYYDPNAEVQLSAPMTRYSGFLRAEYDVAPDTLLYAQGLYTYYTTTSNGSGTLAQGTQALTVPVTNPFIPAALSSLLASRPSPTASFTVVKRFSSAGLRAIQHDNTVYQILAGAKGHLGESGVTWDLSYSHGHTRIDDRITSGGLLYSAVETLLNARDGGASLCAGGLNVFGENPISADCVNYMSRRTDNRTSLTQDNVEGTLQGGILKLPAGDVRFAAGFDYRGEAYNFSADPLLQSNPPAVIGFNTASNTRGSTKVIEGFGELLVPVLADLPLIRRLELDTAYRYSHYNISGGVSAYKADLNWEVVDHLRLRGGYQRAVRAPNVGELFLGSTVNYASLGSVPSGGDPCDVRSAYRTGANGAAVRSLCLAQGVPASIIDSYQANYTQVPGTTTGNGALKPETADTFTIGGVLSSPFTAAALHRMNLSVDFYSISIKNAVGTVSGVTMVGNCFNGNNANPGFSASSPYCQNIVRNPDGTIYNINQPYLNLGGYRTSGVDIQFDWKIPLDAMGLHAPGSLTMNVVANYLAKFSIQNLPSTPFINYAGTIGSGTTYVPWRITSTVGYEGNGGGLTLRWRHLSGMKDYTSVTTSNSTVPGVPSYDTFDLSAHIKVTERFDLRGGIDNLTDKAPLIVGGIAGSTDPSTYDPLGRRFYVGARAKF